MLNSNNRNPLTICKGVVKVKISLVFESNRWNHLTVCKQINSKKSLKI